MHTREEMRAKLLSEARLRSSEGDKTGYGLLLRNVVMDNRQLERLMLKSDTKLQVAIESILWRGFTARFEELAETGSEQAAAANDAARWDELAETGS